MGLGIWPAGIFSLGVMLQYGIMTGGSVSTMRAVTMFLIAMGARITGRIYDMMSALSVTAMMILVESPAYLLDSGFLLSFGCVLGMGLATEKICALAGAEKKWTKALVSPIALQLVTLPVMLKFFGEVSIAGFILNLLVLPSVGVVLTGGMAALLLGILSIPAAKLVILPARVLLLFYEYLCSLAGKSGWSTWIGGEPEIWQILVYYMVLGVVITSGVSGCRKSAAVYRVPGQSDLIGKAGFGILRSLYGKSEIVLVFFLLAALTFLRPPAVCGLEVTILDTGQGDGICIRTKSEVILVDGGSTDQKELGRYRWNRF